MQAALREAARLLGALALPVLLAIFVAGVLIGLLSAMTQIRDRSISVVPRLLALGLVISLLGVWMGERLTAFAAQMFRAAEAAGRPSAKPGNKP